MVSGGDLRNAAGRDAEELQRLIDEIEGDKTPLLNEGDSVRWRRKQYLVVVMGLVVVLIVVVAVVVIVVVSSSVNVVIANGTNYI